MRKRTKSLEPIYCSERGIEERFSIPATSLRTLRCRGGGPPFRKLGARVLYRLDEVERWIETTSQRIEA